MTGRRIGFVVPRYGREVLGGAETLVRCLAEQVVGSGLAEVQVLTTCARDHMTWGNDLPAGESVVGGVAVRRFPMDGRGRDEKEYHELHLRLIRHEKLSREDEYRWVDESAHSPALYTYLEKHGREYDVLIFIPYLFGTTFYGSAAVPGRSVLWPCLHDEVYAYLEPTRDLFRGCRGIMFNTLPEMRLAERLYGRHPGGRVVGFGLEPFAADPAAFRERQRLEGPFILYSGRLEGAKNVPLLLQHFCAYKQRRGGDVKLVLMGTGPEASFRHPDVVQLGFKQGQDKLDAYAAAAMLCQPSVNESFSIVIMESWLCRVPVLVHGNCEVTRYHVTRSNGGLYFHDYDEFEAVLDEMLGDAHLRRRLGENGYAYTQANFTWQKVLERFDAALAHWQSLA